MPSGRSIGVVTRTPTPGNVKTRLAAQIGDEPAAALYAAFLRDVLVSAASLPDASVSVFHPLDDEPGAIERLLPPGVSMQPECGIGYEQILPAALRTLLATAPVAALVGADSPGLPFSTIRTAFEVIESGAADIAICPTTDGGYCLLATNDDYPALFEGVDWGTAHVFEQVTENASRAGLRAHTLAGWYDIDDGDDLQRLVDDLAANVGLNAPATRQALRTLAAQRLPLSRGALPWRVESQERIYDTPWRSLVSDRIRTHTGDTIDYAYLETERAVWVVPVTTDGQILLIRQYRHPVGEIIVEVPAGGGDDDPLQVAARELREETGGVARELVEIASYYPAAAHLTHTGHIVLALGVEFGTPELESTELLQAFTVPFELAIDMARRGEIADSQSALAILAAEPAIRAALDTAK